MKCTCIDGWRRCAVCYGTGALCAICGDPVDEGGSCGLYGLARWASTVSEESGDREQVLRFRDSAILAGTRGIA